MKLTIKDISKYPNLVWKTKNGNIKYKPLGYIDNNGLGLVLPSLDQRTEATLNVRVMDLTVFDLKPIMRPLSQLVEEITHDGETFVPIVELAIEYGVSCLNAFQTQVIKDNYRTIYIANYEAGEYKGIESCGFCFDGNGFFVSQQVTEMAFHDLYYRVNQELLFQKLYKWRFWTGDQSLFKQGILIEKEAK